MKKAALISLILVLFTSNYTHTSDRRHSKIYHLPSFRASIRFEADEPYQQYSLWQEKVAHELSNHISYINTIKNGFQMMINDTKEELNSENIKQISKVIKGLSQEQLFLKNHRQNISNRVSIYDISEAWKKLFMDDYSQYHIKNQIRIVQNNIYEIKRKILELEQDKRQEEEEEEGEIDSVCVSKRNQNEIASLKNLIEQDKEYIKKIETKMMNSLESRCEQLAQENFFIGAESVEESIDKFAYKKQQKIENIIYDLSNQIEQLEKQLEDK